MSDDFFFHIGGKAGRGAAVFFLKEHGFEVGYPFGYGFQVQRQRRVHTQGFVQFPSEEGKGVSVYPVGFGVFAVGTHKGFDPAPFCPVDGKAAVIKSVDAEGFVSAGKVDDNQELRVRGQGGNVFFYGFCGVFDG